MVLVFFVLRSMCCGCVLWCSISIISTNLNTASNNKKQDNTDNPSGPYVAAGSITTTTRNLPTKLMGDLS
jgi:hypothetical protein